MDEGLAVERELSLSLESPLLARRLGVARAWLLKRGVDARGKQVHFVCSVGVPGGEEEPPAELLPLSERPVPALRGGLRPVVVGAGPAGLFAALELAEAGLAPIVLERGEAVEQRAASVERFIQTRQLNPASNVQFGEGGAGTFSDGKLTCGKNSPNTRKILETFVAAGAQQEIRWQAKPHIGTDVLRGVVANIRRRIIQCGGEVRFNTQAVGFTRDGAGAITGVVCASGEHLPTRTCVLACGHSARDTFQMLAAQGVEMERKPFSLGVRVEHLQAEIDRAQYGRAAGHPALGAADYKLAAHLSSGRSAYSFCMCPGGEVVAAASEEGHLCVNGMSNQARNGANANSALLVNVLPADFDEFETAEFSGPLAGIALQRHYEAAAFQAGGANWAAPIQTLGSFCAESRPGTGFTSPNPAAART